MLSDSQGAYSVALLEFVQQPYGWVLPVGVVAGMLLLVFVFYAYATDCITTFILSRRRQRVMRPAAPGLRSQRQRLDAAYNVTEMLRARR